MIKRNCTVFVYRSRVGLGKRLISICQLILMKFYGVLSFFPGPRKNEEVQLLSLVLPMLKRAVKSQKEEKKKSEGAG